MAELDLDIVRHALGVAQRHGFAEVQIEAGDNAFSAQFMPPKRKANPAPIGTTESPSAALAESSEPKGVEVKSPLVGYVKPRKKPLSVGDEIKAGDVVAVIEALGLENDVESPAGGRVEELLFEAGQAVQFGQVLARLSPQ